MHDSKLAPTYIERQSAELLSILLADVANDIEVAARDARISVASFIRLRRATDRGAYAQSVLEAMRENRECSLEGPADVTVDAMPEMGRMATRGIKQVAARDAENTVDAAAEIRTAVELLAKGWPEDYPAGAMEWLLLHHTQQSGAATLWGGMGHLCVQLQCLAGPLAEFSETHDFAGTAAKKQALEKLQRPPSISSVYAPPSKPSAGASPP